MMSNRKKALKKLKKANPTEVILTEDNKKEVGKVLGYSIETVDDMLARAKSEGYKGIRLPLPDI